MYAVVDIETTGGNPTQGKIIEIAIVIYDGIKIIETFNTLVNPQRSIPPFITGLTGITDSMVANSPLFEEIAVKVHRITEGKVFVAHNVNFDFSYLKREFEELGIDFDRKKLCTIRLARKLVPDRKKYNLGSICEHFEIDIKDRHRALGDAEATAILLQKLLKIEESIETKSPKKKRKELSLPKHISKNVYENLPTEQGVYYFHDEQGKIIYISKATNIKESVRQHFSGPSKAKGLFSKNIHKISFRITGNELIALLIENEAIKKHFPSLNKPTKTSTLNFGLYKYIDQSGYSRIVIGKAGKRDKPFIAFPNEADATNFIIENVSQFGLCLRLCGMIKSNMRCDYEAQFGKTCQVCNNELSVDSYNLLVENAFSGIGQHKTFIIKTIGRKSGENGFVMVEDGRFLGFGYVMSNNQIQSIEQAKYYLEPCYDTHGAESIIKNFLKKSRLLVTEPIKTFELV
jgi:DNA polymerase III subunit epsilon